MNAPPSQPSPRALGPLRTKPIVLPKPWGAGSRLRALGVEVPDEPPTGEVWLVSDVDGRESAIVGGPHDGRLLRHLVAERPLDLLGDRLAAAPAPRFPMLVKLLEVQGSLSVQVHPDAIAAKRAGDGERGKHEAWFVVDAARGAEAILGLKSAASRDELRELVRSGTLGDRLSSFPLAQGLAIDIAPGTIHSVRGGALLLEVQETADVTYRLYDWNAVGLDGKPRELQLDKALACARLAPDPALRPKPPAPREAARGVAARLVSSPAAPFRFEVLELDPNARATPRGGGPEAWVALRGRVALIAEGIETTLSPGEAAVVGACAGGAEARALEGRALVARAGVSS